MAWNNLRSTRLNPGDRLTIYSNGKRPVAAKKPAPVASKSTNTLPQNGNFKIHKVKRGDTLWDIGKQYNGTSVNDLKRLNSNLNFKRLKPGMEIKVKALG